jgi:DNA-directed RNA polymerase subunit N (RpoN/RPB10)
MKIRNFFVANSSSASFTCGIAVIHNLEKFMKFINQKDYHTIDGLTISKLSELENERNGAEVRNGAVSIEGFTGAGCVINYKEYIEKLEDHEQAKVLLNDDNLHVATFYESGDDPPYDEDSGEYDYDIDMSSFNDETNDLYNLFTDKVNKMPGVLAADATFGAGRDG